MVYYIAFVTLFTLSLKHEAVLNVVEKSPCMVPLEF